MRKKCSRSGFRELEALTEGLLYQIFSVDVPVLSPGPLSEHTMAVDKLPSELGSSSQDFRGSADA